MRQCVNIENREEEKKKLRAEKTISIKLTSLRTNIHSFCFNFLLQLQSIRSFVFFLRLFTVQKGIIFGVQNDETLDFLLCTLVGLMKKSHNECID